MTLLTEGGGVVPPTPREFKNELPPPIHLGTSPSFVEHQPMHRNRDLLQTFCLHFADNLLMSLLTPYLLFQREIKLIL